MSNPVNVVCGKP